MSGRQEWLNGNGTSANERECRRVGIFEAKTAAKAWTTKVPTMACQPQVARVSLQQRCRREQGETVNILRNLP